MIQTQPQGSSGGNFRTPASSSPAASIVSTSDNQLRRTLSARGSSPVEFLNTTLLPNATVDPATGFSKLDFSLEKPVAGSTVALGNKVVFRNSTGDDPRADSVLRSWLSDVETIEAAGDEDAGVLKFPPELP